MRVIQARNVQQALPQAVRLLEEEGVRRDSRYGPVIVMPCPVTTVYERPQERVLFWPQRDANPALHLYESLWMLAGREDLAPLLRYAKRFEEFSDDGATLWDAYGHRWRERFGFDQLREVVKILSANRDDRRCVIQMWSAGRDLGRIGKAVPCNLTATVQVSPTRALDLAVFNRSNDIVWGCYGANAVHFSMLQEYLASAICVPMGTYTQVSVNWHAYVNTFEQVRSIPYGDGQLWDPNWPLMDPYAKNEVRSVPMGFLEDQVLNDTIIKSLLREEEDGFQRYYEPYDAWDEVVYSVLKAHHFWRTLPPPDRYTFALNEVEHTAALGYDWAVAMKEWVERRKARWEEKQ